VTQRLAARIAFAALTALAGVGAWALGRRVGARIADAGREAPPPEAPPAALEIEDAVEVPVRTPSR
jgi:hypothetical protein